MTKPGDLAIGWVLLSRAAVARADMALADQEKGVRDEVGFLAIHQGFADRFFPGTSVLHTRLRYALFVPWLMKDVAGESNADLLRRFSAAETHMAGQLIAGKRMELDGEGIIGGRVWPRPAAQPPSMAYWSALGAWGLLRPHPNGSIPTRSEVLRRISSMDGRHRTTTVDDEDLPIGDHGTWPFVILPDPPDTFGKRDQPLEFKLTSIEKSFLRKHLLGTRRTSDVSRSLLSRLVDASVGPEADDPWVSQILSVADDKDRKALILARKAAALSGIGRAVYAALAEDARNGDGLPSHSLHADHLIRMVDAFRADAEQLDINGLIDVLPHVNVTMIDVLTSTQKWLRSSGQDFAILRSVYAQAELQRKGTRSRLPDTLGARQRRAEWNPEEHPLAYPIHYRWPNVRQLLSDLLVL